MVIESIIEAAQYTVVLLQYSPLSFIYSIPLIIAVIYDYVWLTVNEDFFGQGEVIYHKTSNISHTLVGNKLVDHLDVVGADRLSALLQLHLHSRLNIWIQWIGQRQPEDQTRNI